MDKSDKKISELPIRLLPDLTGNELLPFAHNNQNGSLSVNTIHTHCPNFLMEAPSRKIEIVGNLAVWGNGYCALPIKAGGDYSYYKASLIKLRYNNDDQIAIMLNRDTTEMERMQRWRDWASDVAKAICMKLGIMKI